jgi:hypothetical protein
MPRARLRTLVVLLAPVLVLTLGCQSHGAFAEPGEPVEFGSSLDMRQSFAPVGAAAGAEAPLALSIDPR